jgi:hypothetical protein
MTNPQAKSVCLTDQLTHLATIPDDKLPPAARDALRQQLVSNAKALFEIKGALLTRAQQVASANLYTQYPLLKYACSGWPDASCPSATDLNGLMDMCYRLSTIDLRPGGVAGSLLSTIDKFRACVDAAPSIAALSPSCAGTTYTGAYDVFISELLKRTAIFSLATDGQGNLLQAPLQSQLERIGYWYNAVRSAFYPPNQFPDSDELWGRLSTKIGDFWRAVYSLAVTPTLTAADKAAAADNAVLRAALNPFDGGLPIGQAPFLEVLQGGLHSMYDRLGQTSQFHDMACLFKRCSSVDAGTNRVASQTTELFRLAAAMPDPVQFGNQLDGGSPDVRPEWRQVFNLLQANHAVFEGAVLDSQAPVATYTPDLILDAGVGTFRPPLRDLGSQIQQATRFVRNYDDTGLLNPTHTYYDLTTRYTTSDRVLLSGLSAAKLQDLQNTVTARLQALRDDVSAYQQLKQQLITNLVSQIQSQGSEANIASQIAAAVTRINQLISNIDGMRLNIDVTNARYADFARTFTQEAAFESDSHYAFSRPAATYYVYATDTHYQRTFGDNVDLVQIGGQRISNPDDPNNHFWPGQVLHISTSGTWSPSCSLQAAGSLGLRGLDRIVIQDPVTGPEGYLITYEGGTYTAHSDQSVHSDGGYARQGYADCKGDSPSGVTQNCYGFTTGEWSSGSSSSSGGDARTSAAFATGIRLPNTPFPHAPVGSALLVQMQPGQTDARTSLISVHVLQRPDSSILIARNADVYLVVNDSVNEAGNPCSVTSGNPLTLQSTIVESVGSAVQALMPAMANALNNIESTTSVYMAQGSISPSELSLLHDGAFSDLATSCHCSISDYPSPLQALVSTWVDKEIAILQKKVAIKAATDALTLQELSLETLQRDLESAHDQSQYVELLPAYTLKTLDDINLEQTYTNLSSLVVDNLYPFVEVRYPGTFVRLRDDVRLANLINLDWTQATDQFDSSHPDADFVANKVYRAVQAIHDTLHDDAFNVQPVQPTWAVLGFPRACPGADPLDPDPPPCAGGHRTSPFSTVDDSRALAVWHQARAGQWTSLEVNPEDLYSAVGGNANFTCLDEAPVIKFAGIYLSKPVVELYQYDLKVPSAVDPILRFVTPLGLASYTATPGWVSADLRVLDGPSSDIIFGVHGFSTVDDSGGEGWSPFTTFDVNFTTLATTWAQSLNAASEIDLVFRVERLTGDAMHFMPSCP